MIQITAQVGDHLRWEEDGAHGGYEEDLGLHQEKFFEPGPHDQAGFHPESHLPGGEHRHVHPSASMNTLELAVAKSNRFTVAVQSYAVFLLAYYV